MATIWRDIPAQLHLAGLVAVGGAAYVGLLYFGARATFDEVVNLVLRRKVAEVPPENAAA